MLKIYYTIEEIYKVEFSNESEEFKKGFEKALALLEIGIKKRTDYNKLILIHELEKDIKDLKKQIRNKDTKILQLSEFLSQTSLISGLATETFREFFISSKVGNFTIVTNMDNNTMNACTVNFAGRNTYKHIDEAKSKLLLYINSKSSQGFKAYKDKSIAIKEGVKVI